MLCSLFPSSSASTRPLQLVAFKILGKKYHIISWFENRPKVYFSTLPLPTNIAFKWVKKKTNRPTYMLQRSKKMYLPKSKILLHIYRAQKPNQTNLQQSTAIWSHKQWKFQGEKKRSKCNQNDKAPQKVAIRIKLLFIIASQSRYYS